MRTGISIGHSMVAIGQIVPAMGGDGLQLVVDEERIHPPGQAAGAIELVFGIGEVIGFMGSPQATFVEGAVMSDQRDIP